MLSAGQAPLRWNGTAWRRITVPFPTGETGLIISDGKGGLGLPAFSPSFAGYFYHDSGSGWSRQRVPAIAGSKTEVDVRRGRPRRHADQAGPDRRVPAVRQPGRARRRNAVHPVPRGEDHPRAAGDTDVRLPRRLSPLPPAVGRRPQLRSLTAAHYPASSATPDSRRSTSERSL